MRYPAWLVLYVFDPLERAAWSFGQQFTVLLLAAGSGGLLVTQNWVLALDSAGFAAAVSILTSVATFAVPDLRPAFDLVLRVAKTFAQSFVGTLLATQVLDVSHADWRGAFGVAFPVALLALIKGIAALGLPSTAGASTLPTRLVEPDESNPGY